MNKRHSKLEIESTRLQLERLKRLYSMLSRINRTIVHTESPNDIYSAACRIAVEEGNLRSANIALLEPYERSLVVIATAGAALDLNWLNANEGNATAENTRHHPYDLHNTCIVNDILSDDHLINTRNALQEAGILAIASFPVLMEKTLFGVFAVGVGEADFFSEIEQQLFEEVADDISYTLDVLRRDEKRLAGEAKMHYLAYYDGFTGLPGRVLFEERLAALCTQNEVNSIAVMVISLRNYHRILQAFGQEAGIPIARAIATRIETMLPTAIAARISEAEFVLALQNPKNATSLKRTAWHIHSYVTDAVIVEQQEIFLDAFIGIAMFPQDGGAVELVNSALAAADRLPQDNGKYCRFFDSGMSSTSRKRLNLDTALRRAISRQEFELYYQPQVDLASGRVVGTEAVLRWQHPQKGLVLPAEFIPMLEETGLICEVGEWVMFEACAACKRWQEYGLPPVRIAVNLSGCQFRSADMSTLVKQTLHGTHLEPNWLELEVTESIILPDAGRIISTLRDLKSLGVSQALDDFGTGYSSLSYLQRLPVQRIKIDRSFIANITSNPNDAAIVRAVVGMAHSLNICVIAEGVETEGQLGYIRGLTCDEMQGFHFDPPLTESAFIALLREDRRIPIQACPPKHRRVLLLVDHDQNIISVLRRALKNTDIEMLTTTNPHKGFDLLAANPVGVVICDQRLPEITGTEFLRRVRELYPTTVRIVLSSYSDLNSVLDAVNRGAIHKSITKPFQDDTFLESLEDAFHLHEIERENIILNRQLHNLQSTHESCRTTTYQ